MPFGNVTCRHVTSGMLLLCLASSAFAADWPTYRHDNARSGVSREHLSLPLHASWVHRPIRSPAPSWPSDQWNEAKAVFDLANHVIAAEGQVFWASSADGIVTALDAATGATRWTFCGGGPVRVAPTYWDGRLYVAGDDGWVRCLSVADGGEVWSFCAAPRKTRVIGHGTIISLWPIRTGVLVDDGVAYVAAGLFPSEGVCVHALDANTGKPIWLNDSTGAAYTQHPHPGCDGFSGVPPQGPMVVDGDRLFIPAGRSVPAAFARSTGRLLYWNHSQSWQGAALKFGGAALSLIDGALVSSPGNPSVSAYATAYDPATGEITMRFREKQVLATPETYFLLAASGIRAVDRNAFLGEMGLQVEINSLESWYKKRTTHEETRLKELREHLAQRRKGEAGAKWRLAQNGLHTMVLADTTVFAGGQDRVIAVDSTTGKQVWEAPVDGLAAGIAVAEGRLFVTTQGGTVHCFGTDETEPVDRPIAATLEPFPQDALSPVYAAAAEDLLQLSGVSKGYCIVLGGGSGRLAYELASRSELRIVCITVDAAETALTRRALSNTPFYGSRLTVAHPAPDDRSLPVPDYCANLIVCDAATAKGTLPVDSEDIIRILRPYGGTICVGQPAIAPTRLDANALCSWMPRSSELTVDVTRERGTWARAVRGALPGARNWTHQYGSAAATACSEDERVSGPLELLWFGEPGPKKGVKGSISPLVVNGRLFIGQSPVQAYDAYNGTPLWENSVRDARFIAAGDHSLYVTRQGKNECTKLAMETGQTETTFRLPASTAAGGPSAWGILAVDGNMVFGTVLSEFQLEPDDAASTDAFAELAITRNLARRKGSVTLHSSPHWLIRQMDTWMEELDGGPGKTVAPDRLAVYKGRMLRQLAGTSSSSLSALDRESGALRWTFAPGPAGYICHASLAIGDGTVFLIEGRETGSGTTTKHVVGLNADTGARLWVTDDDLTTYCKPGPILHRPPHRVLVDSTECLSLAYRDGVIVLGEVWGGQNLFALSARDGSFLWSQPVTYNYYYRRRSMIVGSAVYTDRFAYDLHTGRPLQREHPITGELGNWVYNRSYGCGGSTAGARSLFFRSSVLSYFDLKADQGITNVGGVRPSCWINTIPANGLLVAPDQTRGCTCPYPIKASLALRPTTRERHWSFISLNGPPTPVKHLAINLGAPGDRRDAKGRLWFGYPRPFHPRGFRFDLNCDFREGMGFYKGAPDGTPFTGETPWIYSSGCLGLRKLTIPLQAKGSAPAVFDLDLHIALPPAYETSERSFDVVIQGKEAIEGLTVRQAAGTRQIGLLRTLKGVTAADTLTIELLSKTASPDSRQAPVLNGVEVTRVSPLDSRSDTARILEGKPIGQWSWQAPNELENCVTPGTYDAITRGGATAGDGRAAVHDGGTIGKPEGVRDDSFLELAKITELDGATAFSWTFENVRFERTRNHILAGSIENGFGPGSLFFVSTQSSATAGAGVVSLVLWGTDASGTAAAKVGTAFPGLDLMPDRAWDIQVLFDAGRGPHTNVGCRVRSQGKKWGRIQWRGSAVMKLNPTYLTSPRSQAVFLGKYSPASTLASAFSVGRITLHSGPVPTAPELK